MKILVVGGGAREHALCWSLAREGATVLAAPGNPGIARVAECVAVKADDLDGQARLADERGVDLVVVGPEAPLVAGLADRLADEEIPCFGPDQAGARLEGSKVFAKQFFARHGIPTAEFHVCGSLAEVDEALRRLGDAVVVKADGLAAGKGVVVCKSAAEARDAARRMIEEGLFGEAGRKVVVERRLAGREASVLAITDGETCAILPAAEDHKALLDGDQGPNTGGMGTVSPTPTVDAAMLARVRREVLEPTLRGLHAEGIVYRGVLFAGLMIGSDGALNMLEYNVRFGDPEAEVVLPRCGGRLSDWLFGAATGELPAAEMPIEPGAAVCVVMAAAGYPGTPRGGDEIAGLADAEALADVLVFQAGTRADAGRIVTAGGRVLAVTGLGAGVAGARARAYEAVGRISFPGMQFRRDIGKRGEKV